MKILQCQDEMMLNNAISEYLKPADQWRSSACAGAIGISLSAAAMPIAERMKRHDDGLPHHAGFGVVGVWRPGADGDEVFSRWDRAMPTMAIASLTLSTEAFDVVQPFRASGRPSRSRRETKRSQPPTITITSRLEIMTTSIRRSTASMISCSPSSVAPTTR